MANDQPRTPFLRAHGALKPMPNAIGRAGARKQNRRLQSRAAADFRRVVDTLRPGDVCLDLVADVGDVTEVLAAAGATVHAYEPDPEIFAAPCARHGHRANVVLNQAAFGVRSGLVGLRRPADFASNPELHSVGPSVVVHEGSLAHGQVIEVPQMTLGGVLVDRYQPQLAIGKLG